MPRVIPGHRQYSHLVADIERGDIKIPQFQRDFVWEVHKSATLIDSIVKGYPIGSFILWRTNEQLRTVRGIGGKKFPNRENEIVDYVLDGQQRITSIYCCLTGSVITKEDGRSLDYSNMYIDLESSDQDQIVWVKQSNDNPNKFIKIVDLLSNNFELLMQFDDAKRQKIQDYRNKITAYDFPIISITEATIDIATEVFTRINLGGKELTVFEIMVAKTYSEDKKFDLSQKCSHLIKRLSIINYDTISESTILQVISAILVKDCSSKKILQLDKNKFIEVWDKVSDAIERACEYLRSYYRIPVSQLLPFNAIIVPFAYFFYQHPDKPLDNKQKLLEDFFWRCGIGGRYSSSLESRLNQDLNKVDQILINNTPAYEWDVSISSEYLIQNGYFNVSRSFVKAILCLYAYFQPKSFADNSIVNIDNNWLKQANSKNYHHFFPKKSKACVGLEWHLINNVFNITIVDDFLNKRVIKARNPSDYMSAYVTANSTIDDSMKSHLIGDFAEFGIYDDQLVLFLEKRADKVSDELKKRIINPILGTLNISDEDLVDMEEDEQDDDIE